MSTRCLAQDTVWLEGCVYEDSNQNGIQDKGEKGIPEIPISNGDTVLLADKRGHFRIKLSKGNSIFPILPNNWTLLSNQIVNSGFYYWNNRGDTGTQQVNFGLNKKKVNKHFSMNAIGDVQVGNSQELDYVSRSLWPDWLGYTLKRKLANPENPLTLILGQFENLGSAEISAEPIFLPFHAELKWWEV